MVERQATAPGERPARRQIPRREPVL